MLFLTWSGTSRTISSRIHVSQTKQLRYVFRLVVALCLIGKLCLKNCYTKQKKQNHIERNKHTTLIIDSTRFYLCDKHQHQRIHNNFSRRKCSCEIQSKKISEIISIYKYMNHIYLLISYLIVFPLFCFINKCVYITRHAYNIYFWYESIAIASNPSVKIFFASKIKQNFVIILWSFVNVIRSNEIKTCHDDITLDPIQQFLNINRTCFFLQS